MKNQFFKLAAKTIVFVLIFLSVLSFKSKNISTNESSNPNFTATINSVARFKASGAYAYKVMNNYSIIGNSGKDWITIGFLTKDQSQIVPGTYQINNGIKSPTGQSFSIDVIYKEDAIDLNHTFLSESGTMELTEASSTHFKGTFTCLVKQMKGGSETRTINASFDVNYRGK